MDLLNETVILETKSTHFNLLIRETSHFLCYERLLNMTYVAYKNAFFREMQFWSHCYTVVSYQALFRLSVYKIPSRIPFGCKKCEFLHDTRLWFPDYELLSNAINWFDGLTVNSAGSVSASASNGLWIIRFITLLSVWSVCKYLVCWESVQRHFTNWYDSEGFFFSQLVTYPELL